MFVPCGIWCLADVSSVSPSSEQTKVVCLFIRWLVAWLVNWLVVLLVVELVGRLVE